MVWTVNRPFNVERALLVLVLVLLVGDNAGPLRHARCRTSHPVGLEDA